MDVTGVSYIIYLFADCTSHSSVVLPCPAGLILVDKRYGNARIRNKLPKWIGQSVSVPETFGGAMKTLGTFYRGRREA
jgi:hypothetical protein